MSRAPEGTVQYEATITGLPNAKTFRYAIYDGGRKLTEPGPAYRFTTHPPTGEPAPARIWVVGDSGTGQLHQRLVHEAMRQFTASSKRKLDFYLHVGDMAYGQGTDGQFQSRFFAPYQETLRNTVCGVFAGVANLTGGMMAWNEACGYATDIDGRKS